MAPKQKDKAAQKVVIDKTFGMKNKKGGKAQKEIARLQAQASAHGKNKEDIARQKQREAEKAALEAEKARKKEVAELFTQTPQRIQFGVDPKTVLCQYYKAGYCEKGKKCKFSHDMNVGRKVDKIDVYSDPRNTKDKDTDTMDKWDEARLAEVVNSKHGNPRTTTEIVCKFFIEAIEEGKYGWRWVCPNGEDCKYRHALPPGFVLKQKGKKEEKNEQAAISMEEFIEVERHKLPAQLTPVTPETFAQWKKTRMDKKAAEEETLQKAKQAQAQAGKASGLSGRDLFEFNPELYADSDEDVSDDDWDLEMYRKRNEDEREAAERARILALGGKVDDLALEDDQPASSSAVGAGPAEEKPVEPGS